MTEPAPAVGGRDLDEARELEAEARRVLADSADPTVRIAEPFGYYISRYRNAVAEVVRAEAEAEVTRLRAALEEIATNGAGNVIERKHHFEDLARAVLSTGEGKE